VGAPLAAFYSAGGVLLTDSGFELDQHQLGPEPRRPTAGACAVSAHQSTNWLRASGQPEPVVLEPNVSLLSAHRNLDSHESAIAGLADERTR
jgi:hypothetical protein